MADHLIIFDTTLRDGEQAPGFSMNTMEKLEMARQLARLQVDVIEAGFPISSDEDFVATKHDVFLFALFTGYALSGPVRRVLVGRSLSAPAELTGKESSKEPPWTG